MIYVTGDLHGDIRRFQSKHFRKLKKNDYLIVCGDFGFLWEGSSKERQLLKWIGKRPYHVLFVEGTHDNLDLLYSYPTTQWNGGSVREISGKLKYLCRGSVFQIEDAAIFAFGGGDSDDADIRQNKWWREELPCAEELEAGRENLQKHNNSVDYIITHQCSGKIKNFLSMRYHEPNVLDVFFDSVRDSCRYKRWFFGSFHINKPVPPREIALYDAVTPINSGIL